MTAYAFAQQVTQSEFDHNVRLQIFLIQQNFNPGKIDGLNGKFTEQASKYYHLTYPLKSIENINKSLEEISPTFISYTINTEDKAFVGNVPNKPALQSKNKYMPYRSLAELIAERFHTDMVFLQKINPHKDLKKLQPGNEVIVPNIMPFIIEDLSPQQAPEQLEFATRHIKINTKERLLFLYDGEQLLAVFPITPGSNDLPAPIGKWKIKTITYLPWFRYDKKMLQEGQRSKNYYNIPPGPNSPVGVVWIGLNKSGIGIHGTDTPHTIGRSASHGCIRLSNWDVVKLSTMITKNITVQIE